MRGVGFRGQRITVATLPETATASRIGQLVSGDQLVVSSCGYYVGQVTPLSYVEEAIHHSVFGVMEPYFRSSHDPGTDGSRILKVGAHFLLVWGRVQGYPTGIWYVAPEGSRFLYPLDRLLISVGRHVDRTIIGTLLTEPGQHFYLTSWGLWPVSERARVISGGERLCVLERIQGLQYCYQVGVLGISHFFQINPPKELSVSKAVPWNEKLFLSVTRSTQSWLSEPGQPSAEPFGVDGTIQEIWVSPRGKTLLLLIHPRGTTQGTRRLVMSTGKVLYEGVFSVDVPTIAWSKDELSVAVQISESTDSDQVVSLRVVGSNCEWKLPLGIECREILLGDDGSILGSILHDDLGYTPMFRGYQGTRGLFTWNLHHGPDGAIVWSTIQADQIYTWLSQVTGANAPRPSLH